MALPVDAAGNARHHQQNHRDLDQTDIRPRGTRVDIVIIVRGTRWRRCARRSRRRLIGKGRLGNRRRLGRNVRLDARGLNGHRLICCVRRTFGLRRRTAKALGLGNGLAEIAQTTIAQRRLFGLWSFGAHTFRRFGFDLADRFFKRQPLAGDVGFLKCRLDTAQLGDECRARAVIQGAPILACIFVQAADGPGD